MTADSETLMNYSHTQRGPVWFFLGLIGVLGLNGAWIARDHLPVAISLVAFGGLMLFLASCFATLTVRDEGDNLAIRYGPIPLFHKRIAYESITAAEPTRSALIDGWGIHYIPGRGWTFNLWGWSCVKLTVNGSTIRIGSDDADNLAQFVQTKMAATA
jgi:hypothetical protein